MLQINGCGLARVGLVKQVEAAKAELVNLTTSLVERCALQALTKLVMSVLEDLIEGDASLAASKACGFQFSASFSRRLAR